MNQIKGNGFIITEENGNYTMSWMTGGFQDREVTYPVSKELVDKALRSEQDAYEVELFLQTGEWVTKESKEIAMQSYFRSTPTRILVNPSSVKRLFSNQEFEELLHKAISSELNPTELDAIGTVENHLELLLADPVGWEEENRGGRSGCCDFGNHKTRIGRGKSSEKGQETINRYRIHCVLWKVEFNGQNIQRTFCN